MEEDYLMSIGYKGLFEEGEKALKDFADYLSEHGFVYSFEYEDTESNEYLIQHPGRTNIFDYRRENADLYKKAVEEDRTRRLGELTTPKESTLPFYEVIANWLKKLFEKK